MVDYRRQGAPRRKAFGRAYGDARSAADGDPNATSRRRFWPVGGAGGRVADFYEAKLAAKPRSRIGTVGPLAIIVISLIVGGLIVSVMTALLSVYQVVD